MDEIFSEIPCVVVYIDDLLIFSPSLEQHAKDIEKVLSLLQANDLLIRPDKCLWAKQAVEFLGHHISYKGMSHLQEKVESIKTYPTPKTVKELMSFNSMLNYYCCFIPCLAKTMAPLYDALQGKPKKLSWSPVLEKAFDDTKKALTDSTLLAYPVPNKPLILTTDASDIAIRRGVGTGHG